ncbi:LCP family protein [Oceanobacillus massiliensis]|uniref:LCP family glycopolymer transferase n=1 Tax=Oceanobacillus massiliensis TaxID=1465765 RepID=UPI000289690E|nr:LCP family protein [Oceanobacillus massiliensis]
MAGEKRAGKRRKPRRLWLKITLSVLLVLVLGVGIYAYSIYDNAKGAVNEQMHQKVTAIDEKVGKQKIEEKESLNILLLGVDKRGSDGGRSDALMVLSLDQKNEKMQLVSIPRDTRTMIVGKGFEDKINHAYAFGGTDMSISTVEDLLDIELDYYVEMNMEGLADLIDSLGEITVQNEIDWIDEGFYQEGYHYAEGELTMDGAQTMGFVRMRHKDPQGDFGRTERQRKVIGAIIDKGASVASVGKINSVIDVLGNNMATNMDFDDMKDLLLNYANVRRNSSNYMLQGSGTTIDGIYYYQVPDEELAKVHEMIAEMDS